MSTLDLAGRLQRFILRSSLKLGPSLRRRIAGRPPVNDRGIRLAEDLHWLVWLDRRLAEDPRRSPGKARAEMESGALIVGARDCQPPTREQTLAGRPIRVYGSTGPLLVYFHGGGWVCGSRESHDSVCRRLCTEGGWVVASVDYRLAPEHPFPAGLQDTLEVLREALAHPEALGVDPGAVVAGGDSAGGNLVAAASLVLGGAGEPTPQMLWLVYPALDTRLLTESIRTFAEGFMLTRDNLDWYLGHYAPDVDDPRASPLLGDLSLLPPSVVVTAGFDPLRDEGELLAGRLEELGVPVVHVQASDQIHGFVNMDGLFPSALREFRRSIKALDALRALLD